MYNVQCTECTHDIRPLDVGTICFFWIDRVKEIQGFDVESDEESDIECSIA